MDSLESQAVPATLQATSGWSYEPRVVERRVLRNIVLAIALGALSAAIFGGIRLTLGALLGGVLSIINFKWLASSLRALFELNKETGGRKTPPGSMMKFILRWLLIGAAGYGASRTGLFDAAGIVAGLLAPAAAVILEAGYTTYKTLTEHEAV